MASKVLVRNGRVLLRNGRVALEGCGPDCCGGCNAECCVLNSRFCGGGITNIPISVGSEATFTEHGVSNAELTFPSSPGSQFQIFYTQTYDAVYTVRHNVAGGCGMTVTCNSYAHRLIFVDEFGNDYGGFNYTSCSQWGGQHTRQMNATKFAQLYTDYNQFFFHPVNGTGTGADYDYETECSKSIPFYQRNSGFADVFLSNKTYTVSINCTSIDIAISQAPYNVFVPAFGHNVKGFSTYTFRRDLVIKKACDGSSTGAKGENTRGCKGCGDGGASGIVLPTLSEIQAVLEQQREIIQ
jgi:hypothetical protein